MKIFIADNHPNVRCAQSDPAYLSMFYDKYSGALYGIVLRIVNKEIIAAKVLEIIFKNQLAAKENNVPGLNSEFTSVANHARKKSHQTIKAIGIFEACNNGWKCIPDCGS
jgi:hypothetical protein